MAIGKKGFFYTICSIVLILFVVFSAVTYHHYYRDNIPVIESRVHVMNSFLKNLENDAQRSLYISTFRAILSIQSYMLNNNVFMNNVSTSIQEAVFNGTIEGNNAGLMNYSTVPEWFERISSEGEKLNIRSTISYDNFQIYQDDPWNVNVGMNVSFLVNDTVTKTSFSKTEYIETKISIIGLEDPLYIVFGNSRKTNIINTSVYVNNFDSENIITHSTNGYYITRSGSPSFLQRFENDVSSSEFGIESLLNLYDLDSLGFDIKDSSCVDYIYFNNISTSDYRVNNTPSWFYIDSNHIEDYNLTGLTY